MDGCPRTVGLALLQQRADLLDANVAHRHPVELGRQIFPDTGLFRPVGTDREDRFDLGQVRFRHLGKRAFSGALALL
ncbi:hypothetical protein D9M70_520300 [compost metagenome]